MANELSTIGITVSWGVEQTSGTRPTTKSSYTEIEGFTSVGEVSLKPEQLEVTTLKDTVKRFIDGIMGGAEEVTLGANLTSTFKTAWLAARTAAQTGLASNKACWWCITVPNFESFYFAGMPSEVGLPSLEVNDVLAGEVSVTVNQVAGWATSPTT